MCFDHMNSSFSFFQIHPFLSPKHRGRPTMRLFRMLSPTCTLCNVPLLLRLGHHFGRGGRKIQTWWMTVRKQCFVNKVIQNFGHSSYNSVHKNCVS